MADFNDKLTELERLARAADAAEDAVVAASGQHREDLWSAHHAANRAFLEATAEMVLPLIQVAKAAQMVAGSDYTDAVQMGVVTESLRCVLASIGCGNDAETDAEKPRKKPLKSTA